jgi:TetR/AcrR family transcriptional repressor of mexJK operon
MSTGISPSVSKAAGRPKDAEKARAILNAAENLFMSHGYELTSMDAVAKESGVSKLTIYSHFENKETLFRRVIERKCEEHHMPDNMLSLAQLPPKQGLHIIAMNFMGLLYSHEAVSMFRILQSESVRHPQVAQIFYEAGPLRTIDAFAELLSAWDAKGTLRIPHPRNAVNHFYSILKGEMHMLLMLNLAQHPGKDWMETHASECVEFFLCAYGPAPGHA